MTAPAAHEERFVVRWSDLDANRHLRNTVFSEYATHTRFRMLEANGFGQARFQELRFGPVMFREEIRYRREVRFGGAVRVNVLIGGLSPDGSHWRVRQEVTREEGGDRAAILTIDGAWIDLDTRRLVAPPPELAGVLRHSRRVEPFRELRSVVRA
jgi:acyl-CoA thioester hydrolase